MTKQEILEIFKDSEFVEFYGYMYGSPTYKVLSPEGEHTVFDDIVKVVERKDRVKEDGIVYVWGMPGPDCTFYKFSDYGKTWALTKEEIGGD